MKEAIQKAIEGGWKLTMSKTTNARYEVARVFEDDNFPITWVKFEINPRDIQGRFQEEVLLTSNDITADLLFWQALGKSLGWNRFIESLPHKEDVWQKLPPNEWLAYQHDFINHLAEGKDPESFFNELLTTNQKSDE